MIVLIINDNPDIMQIFLSLHTTSEPTRRIQTFIFINLATSHSSHTVQYNQIRLVSVTNRTTSCIFHTC